MEPLALEGKIFRHFSIVFFASVGLISYDRISDRREMYSDLMGTSCEKIDFEECVFLMKKSSNAKFRLCKFWIYWIDRRHLFSIMGISTDK